MVSRKKALVTGAAKGIGRAIVLDLASQGFDVVVHYNRSWEAAKEVTQAAAAYGVKAVSLQADVTQAEQVRHLVDTTAELLGGISVVVNNVGNYLKKSIEQVTPQEWQEILNTNLNATFYVSQAALPHLKTMGWGRIINLGFAGAQQSVARPLITPYVIAKNGIILYTKALAKQLIEHKITANVVSPGVVENSLSQPLHEIPCQRLATFDDVVKVVNFFVDTNADYITGQVVEVAGGWNL
ncbi:bifunctional dihydropteridine reductase/dihydrofolate reductase TmpR [Tolypothrix sp. FACHB-123]|uniref:bifunctional dihydropteridine reductase/dihydrofolate reductase TmpR n=1 Tax=Tolypothrix sp. FACHB-123 TaxID=2692868 RepID=UPI0016858E50|nr:bifunctional dihydropteridine reductase/dihydrofolate reductase TmpR [Tolypothrix sp. FACHB-123]MBD2357750.1 bifunctional dihydropteridine reductase/dihydrofolate reductase TmpR [Tolypothrix sp. FACHB-123]